MMDIFERILDTSSFTCIMFMIDEESPTATDNELVAFEKMQNTNKLDEIYAIAHDQLGNHDQAKVLRQWIKDQANKARPDFLFAN